jgi:hypothetical protein
VRDCFPCKGSGEVIRYTSGQVQTNDGKHVKAVEVKVKVMCSACGGSGKR